MSKTNYSSQTQCALTVDVEDYFHVAAFDKQIKRDDWGRKYPSRVEHNIGQLLEIFSQYNVKATFFVLGWVANTCPSLVRRIVENGHELASHGYFHQKVTTQSRTSFRDDVYRSKALLEDLSGVALRGYRAPSFSIEPQTEWAFEVLAELGFEYSSSTYPVRHDQYGAPDWPKSLYQRPEGIFEIPIPTLSLLGRNIPIGGGGFFRLYPYRLSKVFITKYISETGLPYCFYFHPWEIDAVQPRVKHISSRSQFRHYLNLDRMESRVCRLLTDFAWNTMSQVYQIKELRKNAEYTNNRNGVATQSRVG